MSVTKKFKIEWEATFKYPKGTVLRTDWGLTYRVAGHESTYNPYREPSNSYLIVPIAHDEDVMRRGGVQPSEYPLGVGKRFPSFTVEEDDEPC